MANPNIVSVANIAGGSLGFHMLTADATAIMTVTAEYLVKINSILVANVDGTNAATVDIRIVKANATPLGITNFDISGTFYLAKDVNVPVDDMLVVVDKAIYLMEGDVLQGSASVASDLDLYVSYDVIIDA
tara:strand:+ start:211 stop:603 length:393 start_codon:yes stop_codon:yes gene_type:complete